MFIGTTNAEAETSILWSPHAKSWLIGKDSDTGRDWGQEEKGMTEDEMAGWHHWLDGQESEWTLGAGDRQGGLVCCDSWGRKELDTAEWLNWTELKVGPVVCVSFELGEICAEVFVCLFILFCFLVICRTEWGGNPVCWWLGLYFCLVVFWMRCPTLGMTGWVILSLIFKWFPSCEFSLFCAA